MTVEHEPALQTDINEKLAKAVDNYTSARKELFDITLEGQKLIKSVWPTGEFDIDQAPEEYQTLYMLIESVPNEVFEEVHEFMWSQNT